MHRRDIHREGLIEHLDGRGWTDEDKDQFCHMIGRSALMTAEGAFRVMAFQEKVDNRIREEIETDFDRVFSGIPRAEVFADDPRVFGETV